MVLWALMYVFLMVLDTALECAQATAAGDRFHPSSWDVQWPLDFGLRLTASPLVMLGYAAQAIP